MVAPVFPKLLAVLLFVFSIELILGPEFQNWLTGQRFHRTSELVLLFVLFVALLSIFCEFSALDKIAKFHLELFRDLLNALSSCFTNLS